MAKFYYVLVLIEDSPCMPESIEIPTNQESNQIFSLFKPSSPAYIYRVLVAIPCFNEELTIGSVILKTKKYVDDVLVVDDGSKDATAEIARKAGAFVISHPKNQGKGASVLTAVHHAQQMDYDALVLLDGDGQHNPDEIPSILFPIIREQKDLVIGSRFLPNGHGNNTVPNHRRLGQITLDLAVNSISDYKSTDTQSGFRALSREALSRFTFKSDGYNIESDMIKYLAKEGIAIAEVPISVQYDTPNGHKKNAFYHGIDIISHIVGLISYERPLLAFGVPGLIAVTFGLSLGSLSLSYYFSTGIFHYIVFMVSITILVLGLLLVTGGFIMNSIAHTINIQKT